MVNTALKSLGAYEETISLKKVSYKDKTIVFFPLSHISNQNFYDDVKKKVDSLKQKNYFFYYEMIKNSDVSDTINFYKLRKILQLPIPSGGHHFILDSILKKNNIKLKKELVLQPEYKDLGLDSLNSKNVDVTINEMVSYYEHKYGEIILDSCDFQTNYLTKSVCKKDKKYLKNKTDVTINFRNRYLINYLLNDSLHNKIAVIYGKAHIPGMIELLNKNKI